MGVVEVSADALSPMDSLPSPERHADLAQGLGAWCEVKLREGYAVKLRRPSVVVVRRPRGWWIAALLVWGAAAVAVVAYVLLLLAVGGSFTWGIEMMVLLAVAGGVAGGAVWFSWLVARRPRIAATVGDDGELSELTLPPEGLAALAGPEEAAAARHAIRWIHPYYLVGCVAPLLMSAVLPWQYLGYYDDSYDDPSMGAFFALLLIPWLVGTCLVFVGASKTRQARRDYVSVASLWNGWAFALWAVVTAVGALTLLMMVALALAFGMLNQGL